MNVLVLQVFVSLCLVAAAILLFLYSIKQADHEHADRLSLAPLDDDDPPSSTDGSQVTPCKNDESSTTTR